MIVTDEQMCKYANHSLGMHGSSKKIRRLYTRACITLQLLGLSVKRLAAQYG